MMTDNEKIAAIIVKARKEKDFSRYYVAQQANIAYNYLSEIEKGSKRSIGIDILSKICRVLDITITLPL